MLASAHLFETLYFIPAKSLGGIPPFSGFIGKLAILGRDGRIEAENNAAERALSHDQGSASERVLEWKADPASKPIKWVSVPRYTRLGSPPSSCVVYSQAIQPVLAAAIQPAATPRPVRPVRFNNHSAANGHRR